MLNNKKGIFLLILFLVPVLTFGQAATNSPYSRFGLGDQQRMGFTRNIAMGGISLGMRDPGFIDFQNPASLSSRDSLSFLFEFGMVGKQSELSMSGESAVSKDISFKSLSIAFPITKWLGAAAGIVPYSSLSYKIEDQTREGDSEYDPEIGGINYLYEGSGGVHKFFAGFGADLFKGLSLGINLSYLFGNLERSRSLGFVDQDYSSSIDIVKKSIFGDLGFDLGIQYTYPFKEKFELTVGAVLNNERNIKAETESLTRDILYSSTRILFIDTLDYISGVKGKIVIPRNLGIGFTFRYGDKLTIGADYFWQSWSNAIFFGENDSLINSNSLHAGLEFVPNRFALRNYLNHINYRIGGYYSNSYLQLEGEQLKDFGISFGVGLPLNRNGSMINLSFELGKRGTKGENLIEERYGMICFSLTLYDIWFRKRKFD